MSNVNERIDILKKEIGDLRKEVGDLKETLKQQNELIISLLTQQTGMLDETLEADKITQNHDNSYNNLSRRFPLDNVKDLKKLEMEINDNNKEQIINIMKSLLSPRGLMKNISNILSENLILESNTDGHHKKTRLLNFPKIIDAIYMACRKDDENYTSKMFLDDFRRALKTAKNRFHKYNCRARQRLKKREEQEQADDFEMEDDEEEPEAEGGVASSFLVKTEEIYFE